MDNTSVSITYYNERRRAGVRERGGVLCQSNVDGFSPYYFGILAKMKVHAMGTATVTVRDQGAGGWALAI